MIVYERDHEMHSVMESIASRLGFHWIDFSRVVCVRSRGSSSSRTIARCHALPRIMQEALCVKAHYVIEAVSENFDGLSPEEKTKTLIHELMHIPKAMGGGFRHHRPYVTKRTVERMYGRLLESSPGRISSSF
jgi:predicted metallopeptidase